MSAPSRIVVPRWPTNPVTASMKVVLPAPFGPISPTSSPGCTSMSTSTTAWTPPNDTEMLRAERIALTAAPPAPRQKARFARSPRHSSDDLLSVVIGRQQRARLLLAGGGLLCALRRHVLAIRRPGDTLRILDERDDHEHTADEQRPVAGDVQLLLEEVRHEPLG